METFGVELPQLQMRSRRKRGRRHRIQLIRLARSLTESESQKSQENGYSEGYSGSERNENTILGLDPPPRVVCHVADAEESEAERSAHGFRIEFRETACDHV